MVYSAMVVLAPTLESVTVEIWFEIGIDGMMMGLGSNGFVHRGWQDAGPRIDSVRFVSAGPVVTTDT
jgi:hypothetical protein